MDVLIIAFWGYSYFDNCSNGYNVIKYLCYFYIITYCTTEGKTFPFIGVPMYFNFSIHVRTSSTAHHVFTYFTRHDICLRFNTVWISRGTLNPRYDSSCRTDPVDALHYLCRVRERYGRKCPAGFYPLYGRRLLWHVLW